MPEQTAQCFIYVSNFSCKKISKNTFVFFFFAFDGLISPEDASEAVPNDDASPPCTGAIKLVPELVDAAVVVLLLGLLCVAAVASGGGV